MKVSQQQKTIFKKGSKTYFNSSKFFPENVRADVFVLYAFVRVADDYVDATPQDGPGFYRFVESYRASLKGQPAHDPVIDDFVELMKRKDLKKEWVEAFLHSMELDLKKKTYETLEETLEYIYGSAEVIGLFMAKLLDLPEESYHAAQMLGRSMQYINFIRDVKEDYQLGRRYLPLKDTPLKELSPQECLASSQEFSHFIQGQTALYLGWQKEAEQGFKFIPRKLLIPIKTASEMYNWTAKTIHKNPVLVWKKKVKPSKLRILWTVFKNTYLRKSP